MTPSELGIIAIDVENKIIYSAVREPYDVQAFDNWAVQYSGNNPDIIDDFTVVLGFLPERFPSLQSSSFVVIFFDIQSEPWHLKYSTE